MMAETEEAVAELRLLGARANDAVTLRLPSLPTHVVCGYDRALRPVVAVRWREDGDLQNRSSSSSRGVSDGVQTPLWLWDSRSSASTPLVKVVDAARGGKPLIVLAAAVDATGGCVAGSSDGGLWSCGADGQAHLLFRRRRWTENGGIPK